jgi:hypothetical protein
MFTHINTLAGKKNSAMENSRIGHRRSFADMKTSEETTNKKNHSEKTKQIASSFVSNIS